MIQMIENSEKFREQLLQQWIRATFHLSKDAVIKISEHSYKKFNSFHTEVTIEEKIGKKFQYQVNKPITEVTEKDIKRLRYFAKFEKLKNLPIIGNLFRFLGLWLAFTGVYAMFSVCPFCGQAGCPVGAGSAGVIGGSFAFAVNNGRQFVKKISFLEIKKMFYYIFSKKRKI